MRTLKFLAAMGAAAVLALGCVEKQAVRDEPVIPIRVGAMPTTLAVFPFENNSVTDSASYEPLSNGLMAMLITDLGRAGTSLRVIERHNIKSLLKELALSQSGVMDESTALRAGKILGARSIAFGSFTVLGGQVRIDTRIINTETSELIMADSILGQSTEFLQLERRLALKIARTLKVSARLSDMKTSGDIRAAVDFSSGVEAWDRGDREEAERWFAKAVRRDPAFGTQVESIRGAKP